MQNTQKKINTQLYHRLSKYIIPHRKMLTLALFGMVMMALTLSALPALILQLFDKTHVGMDPEALIQPILLAIIAFLIAHGIASFISTYAIHSSADKVCIDLRLAMFNKLLSLPVRHYAELTSYDLTNRFITDLNAGVQAIINATIILVRNSLVVVFLLAWMFYLNRELTLFILLILAVMLLVSQLVSGYLDKTNQQALDSSKRVINELFKALSNYQTVRIHGGQSHESGRFKSKIEQMHYASLRQTNAKTLSVLLGRIIAVIILTTISYFLIQQAHNNKFSFGEIASLMTAATILFLSLNQILRIHHYLLQGQQSLDNIFSFLDKNNEIDTGTIFIGRTKGELVFDKVSLFNDTSTQPVLDSFSLTIKPRKVIALICTSDDEKTALINLISRITQPTSGRILLDGYDLANLKLSNLHSNIALISHKTLLFDDTAAMNIAYGAMGCTNEAEITAAAFTSHVADFIREMPEGLQTKIGEDGAELTEIQCQYIAIARALLKDPSILIVDEIPMLAASDIEIEHLREALEKLIRGRSTLIIARHPPKLVKIDQTFRLTKGKLTSY